jgi:Zn-dependent M28 family amino/carboxypeptidase
MHAPAFTARGLRSRLACAAAAAVLGACVGTGEPATLQRDPFSALTADSATILENLRVLSADAMQGRGTGTEGAARARAWLREAFAAAGLESSDGSFEHPFGWPSGNDTATTRGVNVVGLRRGADLTAGAIVVSAHYDHEGVRGGEIYNGADDNASGTIALVALARALRLHSLRHDLLFVALDAEEVGLRGARAFVASPPVPIESIAFNVNMDMIARTAGVLWAAGASHTPALRPLLEGVAATAPLTLRLGHDRPGAPEGDDWTGASDHGAFHDAGIPFLYLGVEDHPDYHRPTDDFERVDPGEYMDALRTVLMTLLQLDRSLPLAAEGGP